MAPHSEVALNEGVNPINGYTTHGKVQHQHKERSRYLTAAPTDSDYDLICVGFGPASLAIAVAIHDAVASGQQASAPKVLFIEKQARFAWHAGMLLPGAKMQISFVKDLATLRDPRSEFTFLNYLHRQGRLVDFTNLGTFLPARVEYEDYLRWSASFFDHLVQYNKEVVSVSPVSPVGKVNTFSVTARDVATGQTESFRGRNVLLATGGQPSLPQSLPPKHPRVLHSSQYAHMVPRILKNPDAPYRVTVIGAGQSAAEIFHNMHSLYPNCQTRLVMRQEFLRPSDDSPFVNSVFNPEYIDTMFPRSARNRSNLLAEARATNYGVVRLNLIEDLYERMYEQRRELGPDEAGWPHRIMGSREIRAVHQKGDEVLEIRTQNLQSCDADGLLAGEQEIWEADLVIAATGYQRNAHLSMLQGAWNMLPLADATAESFGKGVTGWEVEADGEKRKLAVGRDYQVQFSPGTVAKGSGVWLQGCCEGTHGLSDTLLSVLATRSGEIVDSIFGQQRPRQNERTANANYESTFVMSRL